MRPGLIATIFRKDFLDSIRDSRVLVSIFLPVLIGVFYNFAFQDEQRTKVTVAYSAAAPTTVTQALQRAVPAGIDLTIEEVATADAVRERVRTSAHLGLVIPAGFDQDVQQGRAPALLVITREQSVGGQTGVLIALDGVLRGMAGQRSAVQATTEAVEGDRETPLIAELGLQRYLVLGSVTMLVGFIALIVVPIILSEEVERRTMEALTLVASTAEVVAAKALVGVAYTLGSLALLMAATRLAPADPVLFVAGVLVLTVSTVGFGLLLGGLFKTSAQAYTWSGFFLIPVIMPAFLLGSDLPRAVELGMLATPTAQATRVMANAVAGRPIFPDVGLAFGLMALWGLFAYALVVWRLRRNAE